jgi:hypothetical protein
MCPCGWQECPTGQRYGHDSPPAVTTTTTTSGNNNTAPASEDQGHQRAAVHSPSSSLPPPPDPLLVAFVAHVTAALNSNNNSAQSGGCHPLHVKDFRVVRCPRPPVLLSVVDLGSEFDVNIAHRTSYVHHPPPLTRCGSGAPLFSRDQPSLLLDARRFCHGMTITICGNPLWIPTFRPGSALLGSHSIRLCRSSLSTSSVLAHPQW